MIDLINYALPLNHYSPIVNDKKTIVIGHTNTTGMNHYIGWLNRLNGSYSKTAAYTITLDGNIYNHFEPYFHSNYFDDKKQNNDSIIILLENEGWLTKNKQSFNTWLGDIYIRPDKVIEKKWRGYLYWAPYSKKQEESLNSLLHILCEQFNISKDIMNHNTLIDGAFGHNGIIYNSNINKNLTDLSPAWDFKEFKTNFEKNDI